MTEQEFLERAVAAAKAAGHVWPEHAACEAALESAWGASALAVQANNLFGQKQTKPPMAGTGTVEMQTRECYNGEWFTVPAQWVKFADWAGSFAARMRLLRAAAAEHPHYAEALAAQTGEGFVRAVSATWSTDPQRAEKVMAVYKQHFPIQQEAA